jgi:hypothetical protein
MRRRDILLFLTGAVIWPAQVRTQQLSSKMWRVAFLYPGTIGDNERSVWEIFINELKSLARLRRWQEPCSRQAGG